MKIRHAHFIFLVMPIIVYSQDCQISYDIFPMCTGKTSIDDLSEVGYLSGSINGLSSDGIYHIQSGLISVYAGFMFSSMQEVEITHNQDWNLIGLPLVVDISEYSYLFPDAIESTLFSFSGGYIPETSLIEGVGYWLRFYNSGTTTIVGNSINEITLSLNFGWNLISGISDNINTGEIIDSDNIIIDDTFYGLGNGYILVDELVPGNGYWVRTNSSGSIILTSD